MKASCFPLSFHYKRGGKREDRCKIGHSHLTETLSFEEDATVNILPRAGDIFNRNISFCFLFFRFCMIYHLSKPVPLKSTSSVAAAAGGKEASITAAESKISAEDRHHASDITDPET